MTEKSYSHEEIIWKYIDGNCARDEKKWVETELTSNSSFREMYNSCLETHKHLKAMECESPSVRFVQNVVEALPLAIHRKQYKLIPGPVWK